MGKSCVTKFYILCIFRYQAVNVVCDYVAVYYCIVSRFWSSLWLCSYMYVQVLVLLVVMWL